MKCLVTGAKGCIGTNLCTRLKSERHEVVEFTRGDDLSTIFHYNSVPVDMIFHCAAEMYDEGKMFESNVVLTHLLLNITHDIPYSKFIYMGSSSEYGPITHPRSEIVDKIYPIMHYDATKGCGTLLCQAIARQYGKPIIVVRPFNVYGPYEKSRRLMPSMFRCKESGGVLHYDPNSSHDWTYVDDIVNALITLMTVEIIPGDVINVGTGKSTTNRETVEEFCSTVGKINTVDTLRVRLSDCKFWKADTSYTEKRYGITCPTSLRKGLSLYYKWRKSQCVA